MQRAYRSGGGVLLAEARVLSARSRGLPAEVELILSCARVAASGEDSARIRAALRPEIDWSRVLQIARPHKVLPLVYSSLLAAGADNLPESVMTEFGELSRRSLERNLALAAELARLGGLWQAQGLAALAFKGPEFGLEAYGSLAIRPFHDLDVLIEKRDTPDMSRLLVSEGYQQKSLTSFESCFQRADGLAVDLHWRLGPRMDAMPRTFEQLWERARWVEVSGARVRTVSPEDLLLIFSVQLARDRRARIHSLSQLSDCSSLLRSHPSLEWSFALRHARTAGISRRLSFSLLLAHDMIGAAVPADVLALARRNRTIRRLAEDAQPGFFRRGQSVRFFWDGAPKVDERRSRLGWGADWDHGFQLRVTERLGERLRYLRFMSGYLRRLASLALAPSEQDRTFLRQSRRLRFVYRAAGPLRVLCRYTSLDRVLRRARPVS